MSRTGNTDADKRAVPAGPGVPDADRRRFLVAGLAAAPLIVTLSARPVFAQTQGTLGGYIPGSPGGTQDPFTGLSTFSPNS